MVREVDRKTAVKLRRIEANAETAKYRAAVAKSRAEARDNERAQRFAARAEIAKLRVAMTAREAASKHIAVFGPLYLLLLVASFIASISYIPESQISVVSALLTLLVTSIAANLRSIVAGESSNGDDENSTAARRAAAKTADPR